MQMSEFYVHGAIVKALVTHLIHVNTHCPGFVPLVYTEIINQHNYDIHVVAIWLEIILKIEFYKRMLAPIQINKNLLKI